MRRPRRRPQPQPWERNWRNPDMLVLRSWLEVGSLGNVKHSEEVTPKQSSELSAENVHYEDREYRNDPSYYWAREARRKRKR